jgi:hypothetical protein
MCPNWEGNEYMFSNRCARKTEAARAEWQSRKTGLTGQPSTRGVTRANSLALGTRQARGIRDDEGEPMADDDEDHTRAKEVTTGERDGIMAETAGETEIEMGAAASNY